MEFDEALEDIIKYFDEVEDVVAKFFTSQAQEKFSYAVNAAIMLKLLYNKALDEHIKKVKDVSDKRHEFESRYNTSQNINALLREKLEKIEREFKEELIEKNNKIKNLEETINQLSLKL